MLAERIAKAAARENLPVLRPGHSSVDRFFELGGRTYVVRGIPGNWESVLPSRLVSGDVSVSRAPGRVVDVVLTSHEDLRAQEGTHDLNETSKLHFDRHSVVYRSDWCEGRFDRSDMRMARLECHVEGGAWFGGMLENWLRICVAYDNLGRGAVLLHSAGIVRENRAAVLFGHSGAGKSTCSALAKSEGCSVISDDINLIRPGESTWQVVPLPFSGTFNEHSDIERPVVLDGLFHLNQAGRNGREDCSAARAVSLLAASSPFVNSDPWMAEALMENLSRLVSMVPVRKLFFQRDPSFIEWVFGAAS